MVYCVRIKEGSWYELVECDHCDTTTLEDDVFYSDTESSDSSMCAFCLISADAAGLLLLVESGY